MNHTLTKGNITKSLILFSLPFIFGNLLQQFYNLADTYIVGQYIGTTALAAVGSSYTFMTFITSIILGLCMGSGVLFSMLFGANETNKMKTAFFISFMSIAVLSLLIQFICIVNIHSILHFLNTPSNIDEMTSQYLKIICYGFFFTFLYNYFASLLRALGNSKVPLIFLGISTILNVLLDITLIVSFHQGVEGAAISTIISQAMSGVGIMIYTFIKYQQIIPSQKDCYFDKELFHKLRDYSLLTCLQQSVMNFGILMIQGLVNSFGVITMSAFAAAVKIDSLAYMPVQDFGNAFSTFIAQNKGAHLENRIHKGLRVAIIISSVFCIIISLGVVLFAKELMLVFIQPNEVEIIQQGIQYLQIEGSCYLGIGCLFLLYGYYRGVGKPFISVILTIISLGTRVLLAYLCAPYFGTWAIWWAIPIGWFLADITGILYGIKKENWRSI